MYTSMCINPIAPFLVHVCCVQCSAPSVYVNHKGSTVSSYHPLCQHTLNLQHELHYRVLVCLFTIFAIGYIRDGKTLVRVQETTQS